MKHRKSSSSGSSEMKKSKMNGGSGSGSGSASGSSTLFSNPLSESHGELRHSRSYSNHHNKENVNINVSSSSSSSSSSSLPKSKSLSTQREREWRRNSLKASSLQLCMEINDHLPLPLPLPLDSLNSKSLNIWDYSDSESAPASSWSTLPNKSLICRPLPIEIGRCTCVIVKEEATATPPHGHGLSPGTLFSLYTYEGEGRENRKLAVAHHKRGRSGRSEFTVAQNLKGLLSSWEDTFLGTVTANLTGSKYQIWDQEYGRRPRRRNSNSKQSKHPSLPLPLPLAVVEYVPTIPTCVGSHRSIKAYLPNHDQTMSFKNNTTTQVKVVQHIKGLPINWKDKLDNVHQLFSRVPLYNKATKQFELDFRDKERAGLRIQRSVKNFQLTLEENGRHTILQLGRVGKSNFVMDYRYPLTGYQAFSICLASIDAKLCCIV